MLVLFTASGCAALIYEIVWFQLLELVIGSSTISLGILLGTFMGGLCLGSLALPRLVSPAAIRCCVYGFLELGIGAGAIMLLLGLPLVGSLYVAYAAHGLPSVLLRGALCALLLLPPTVLMGATLPAIARALESSRQGVSWLGILYTGNIVGAVLGSLLAGFYLLRIYDMAVATYVAAAINAALAAIAFALAATTAYPTLAATPTDILAARPAGAWAVYVAIGLSGLTALGSQVVWTRVLGLLLGATVYTFSIILAVFLCGLGFGSGFGSFLARTGTRPRLALGICQLLLVAAVAWTAANINGSLPYWPISTALASSPWYLFQLDLARGHVGGVAAHLPVGRELSAGAGGGGFARRGHGPDGGRGLCRQHRRRHHRGAGVQHRADPRHRHLPIPAPADRRLPAGRARDAGCADAGAASSRCRGAPE